MKKIYAIIAAALVMAVSCTVENEIGKKDSAVPEGAMVKVDFSVLVPDVMPETKADDYTDAKMGDIPVLKKLNVAVFSGSVLNEYATAKLSSFAMDEETGLYKANYSVMLRYTDNKRYIHFIGNPQHGEANYNKSETILMPEFYTDNNVAGYWQRVEVDGIRPETIPDTDSMYGDAWKYYFKKADGSETDDPSLARDINEYYFHLDPKSTTYTKLQNVYLSRNFAKIMVESAQSDFTVTRYALINAPDRGSIAPYTGNGFAASYQNVTSLTYATVKAGYKGWVPKDASLQHSGSTAADAPAESEFCIVEGDKNPGLFTYERTIPTENPMMVLLGGKFTGDNKEYFYKIEITNDDYQYVPLYRNFLYTLKYTGFHKEDGETSIEKAFLGYAFGDVSSSIATANLTKITDATSTIEVSTMEKTFLNNETSWNGLTYNYYPNKNSTTTANDKVTATVMKVDGFGAAVYEATVSNGTVTLGLYTQDGQAGVLKSKVRISGQDGGRPIYRDVVIRVMPTPTANVECSTLSSDGAGQTMTVTITLPAELGASLFPLEFDIESNKNNLKSSVLPVSSGTSMFSAAKNSFHFINMIQYSDFEKALKEAPAGSQTVSFTNTFTTTLSSGNQGAKIIVEEKSGNCKVDMVSDTM